VSARNDDLETIAVKGGREALVAIPGVGAAITGAIAEMLATGGWAFLDHLKGTAQPEILFQSVPGVAPALVRRLCKGLQVDTLEVPEAAAHDGRLEQGPGRAALANSRPEFVTFAQTVGYPASTNCFGLGIRRRTLA
jgi:DNA polymerase/3'-5' exonuclease PolX